jgi:hypothetical protein
MYFVKVGLNKEHHDGSSVEEGVGDGQRDVLKSSVEEVNSKAVD